MKKNKHDPLTALGEIQTRLAGRQYISGDIAPGEKVRLEREPDSSYDPNTIRVQNLDLEDVGYVPRYMNVWLSPLIDQGKILLEAYIPDQISSARRQRLRGHIPLNLKVFLTAKGKSILKPAAAPGTEVETLQEAMRLLYKKLSRFQNADHIHGLRRRLRPVLTRDATPETHLIVNLFSSKAEKIRAAQSKKVKKHVRRFLTELRIGEAVYYRNLTIFPIHKTNGKKADYVLLKNAVDSQTAVVEEVSSEGQVNELLLHNRGDKPILIPEGEILVGAKQNRVVNISLIAAAHISLRIPVSCVEQGRWRFTAPSCQPEYFAHPKLRRRKLESVNAFRREMGAAYSDQGEVWDEVSQQMDCLQAHSSTDSVTDGYKNSEAQAGDYREHISPPHDAVGAFIAVGDHIVGMDCFDAPDSFHQCWERLSNAYFMDAVYQPEKPVCPQENVQKFLDRIQNAVDLSNPSIGLGNELIIQNKDCTGAGVWYSDSLCHLSAFDKGQSQR